MDPSTVISTNMDDIDHTLPQLPQPPLPSTTHPYAEQYGAAILSLIQLDQSIAKGAAEIKIPIPLNAESKHTLPITAFPNASSIYSSVNPKISTDFSFLLRDTTVTPFFQHIQSSLSQYYQTKVLSILHNNPNHIIHQIISRQIPGYELAKELSASSSISALLTPASSSVNTLSTSIPLSAQDQGLRSENIQALLQQYPHFKRLYNRSWITQAITDQPLTQSSSTSVASGANTATEPFPASTTTLPLALHQLNIQFQPQSSHTSQQPQSLQLATTPTAATAATTPSSISTSLPQYFLDDKKHIASFVEEVIVDDFYASTLQQRVVAHILHHNSMNLLLYCTKLIQNVTTNWLKSLYTAARQYIRSQQQNTQSLNKPTTSQPQTSPGKVFWTGEQKFDSVEEFDTFFKSQTQQFTQFWADLTAFAKSIQSQYQLITPQPEKIPSQAILNLNNAKRNPLPAGSSTQPPTQSDIPFEKHFAHFLYLLIQAVSGTIFVFPKGLFDCNLDHLIDHLVQTFQPRESNAPPPPQTTDSTPDSNPTSESTEIASSAPINQQPAVPFQQCIDVPSPSSQTILSNATYDVLLLLQQYQPLFSGLQYSLSLHAQPPLPPPPPLTPGVLPPKIPTASQFTPEEKLVTKLFPHTLSGPFFARQICYNFLKIRAMNKYHRITNTGQVSRSLLELVNRRKTPPSQPPTPSSFLPTSSTTSDTPTDDIASSQIPNSTNILTDLVADPNPTTLPPSPTLSTTQGSILPSSSNTTESLPQPTAIQLTQHDTSSQTTDLPAISISDHSIQSPLSLPSDTVDINSHPDL